MKTLLTGLAFVMAASASASAQQTVTNNTGLVLEIMARRTGSAAGDFDASQFDSYIYASSANSCGLGAGDSAPASTPVAGWRVTGKVLGTTKGPAGDQLVVNIDWERRWESGAAVAQGPRGSVKLTMSSGDTVVLDRIPQAAAGNCASGDLRLVTSVVSRTEALRPEWTLFDARGYAGRGVRGGAGAGVATTGTVSGTGGGMARGSTGLSTAGGGSGAATAGTGTGRGGGRGAGTASTTAGGGGGAGVTGTTTNTVGTARGGRGGAGGGGTFARPGGAQLGLFYSGGQQYTAELWLVHKQPNGEEHVQQLSNQLGPAGTEFSFPPVPVNTSRGVVTVDITGRLQMNPRPGEADPASARMLYGQLQMRARASSTTTRGSGTTTSTATETSKVQVSLSRRARSTAAALDTSGTSSMAIDLPKAEEVLSFEFPPLQKATEDLLAGHKFSLRLRLTPVK